VKKASDPPNDSWHSPQTIIAIGILIIVAGTVFGVFWKGDAAIMNTIAGLVVGSGIGSITGFYFGSSRGSQVKDVLLANKTQSPK
jgi:hypothetical protein